jgi:serine/threonine protein kinase
MAVNLNVGNEGLSRLMAKLHDGRTIEYYPKIIGEGATKQVYLTKDNQSVIGFYKNCKINFALHRLTHLQKVLTSFNPTISNKYWQELFCWPTNIVVKPKFGVMMPIYPNNFLFSSGRWRGKIKKSRWFISPKLSHYLPVAEQGSWIDYFKISILLARAVSRLHLSGLAHSDLSDNNILIDPTTGKMLITDIDTLVVPKMSIPEVDGTPGYIAPEVLATIELSSENSNKNLANIYTDQHALAVLIYELLLNRHPLRGPKINSTSSAATDEYLSMGELALFIEHPTDFSNHLVTTQPLSILGAPLTKLFHHLSF